MADCTNQKCNTRLPGQWQPVVLLWPEGYAPMQCQPITITLNHHFVCEECRKTAKPLDLIPLENFTNIQKTVVGHGKRRPSLKTAKLQYFVPDTFGKGFAGELKQ